MSRKEEELRHEALRLLARWLSANNAGVAGFFPDHDYVHDLRTLGLVAPMGNNPSEAGAELIEDVLRSLREEEKVQKSTAWMDETLGLRILGACYEKRGARYAIGDDAIGQMIEDGFVEIDTTARITPSRRGLEQIAKAISEKPQARGPQMTRPNPSKLSF